MDELSVSKARIPTDTFDKVVYKGERVRIKHRCGKTVVLISEEDLQLLEELEDRLDAEAANKALKEFRESGEEMIPYETIRREAGLE